MARWIIQRAREMRETYKTSVGKIEGKDQLRDLGLLGG
jgi:hypothetical protein